MIKLFVMDVDGTLTDGKIYMGENGEVMKAFNIKDGLAICEILPGNNIIPAVITGRKSEIVSKRMRELGVTHILQGVSEKLTVLNELCSALSVSLSETAYIGDDINDLDCLNSCGFSGAPSDAVAAVRDSVDYICIAGGGNGTVREFVEEIIRRNAYGES